MPEIDIINMWDIHPNFAEDNLDVELRQDGVKVMEHSMNMDMNVASITDARGSREEGEGYEWMFQ